MLMIQVYIYTHLCGKVDPESESYFHTYFAHIQTSLKIYKSSRKMTGTAR